MSASLLLLARLFCGIAEPSFVGTPAAPLDASAISRRTERWIGPYVAAGDFSGVVLIAQGDRIFVEQTYGKADFLHDVPNRTDTRFRIASLTKTFTAAAIELLIAEGKLSLGDHLTKYVGGIPNGETITVEQLLTHESGVGELDEADVYRTCLSPDEIIRRLQKVPPLFAPGTSDRYSNEGYFLLAVIVEKISGIPYAEFIRQKISAPLQLANTGSFCKEPPTARTAVGHVPGASAANVVPLPFEEAAKIGAGSVSSTAEDLWAWLRAVDTKAAFQPWKFEYPYGWGKRNYSGRNLIEQSGILEGFNAHMALYPKEHLYAVVLSNVQSGMFNRIPKDLEAILFGGETSRPIEVTPVALGAAALQEYAGTYKAPEIPVLQNLVVQDGQLAMRWGTYPFLRILTPTAKDEFFFRYEYARVRFDREDGKITGMTWQWPEGKPMTFRPIRSGRRNG